MVRIISVQLLSLFNALQHAHGWMSVRELIMTSGIPERTVRHHIRHLINAGVLQEQATPDAHRFRLTPGSQQHELVQRMREAVAGFVADD